MGRFPVFVPKHPECAVALDNLRERFEKDAPLDPKVHICQECCQEWAAWLNSPRWIGRVMRWIKGIILIMIALILVKMGF